MMKSVFVMAAPGGDTWTPAMLKNRHPRPQLAVVPVERVNPPPPTDYSQEINRLAERVAELEKLLENKEVRGSARATIITKSVAVKHRLTVNDIKGPFRRKEIVEARHEAFYRLRTETTMSYPAIGRFLGGKDHTTVLNGVSKHARANGLPIPGRPHVG